MNREREEALKLSQEPIDLTGATVERERRPVKMSYSFRIRGEDEALAIWLEDEADRRGITPNDLVRELAEEARLRASQGDREDRVVPVGELHRLIDRIAQRSVAA
ncbi:hypothetical protein [Micromonospora maritima]|uniref:hypothetical protein n=1 Tax=Micromonospora maritima TaxID=986711 RepID=UPI00157CFFEA|nr:hypothetical protein [Micromonospora maritima]